jgi:molybdopterin converting factor small subunit
MPWVQIPPPFRGPTHGAERVEVRGSNVRECLEALSDRFIGFREQVFDAQGNAQRFIKLFVNGGEISRQALDTKVAASDQIEILAAVAGG